MLGFGLFGKNLVNVWAIVLGVYLYARFRREPFAAHVNTAYFGAALAPVFSEILFSTSLPFTLSLPLALATSLAIEFVLAPAAAHLFKAHMGFSLYNMGFTAGIVGTLIVALYKSYGFVPDPVFIWTTGHNLLLGTFLTIVFASMLYGGYRLDADVLQGLRAILREPGRAPSDFIAIAGFGPTLANMGLTGFVGMVYVLAIGGDLNGPVIGAILTIVGFSAFGKHPGNIIPIMLGVFLGSLLKPWAAPTLRSRSPRCSARRSRRSPDALAGNGRRRRLRSFVRRDERRAAARRPQPLQQRLRRRDCRLGAGSGYPRPAGGVRLRRWRCEGVIILC